MGRSENRPSIEHIIGAVRTGLGRGSNLPGILTIVEPSLEAMPKNGFIPIPLVQLQLELTFPSKTRKKPTIPPLLVPKQPEVLLPFTLVHVTPIRFPNVLLNLTVQVLQIALPTLAALVGQPIALSADYLDLLLPNTEIPVPPPRNTRLPFASKRGQTASGLLALIQNTKRALAAVGPMAVVGVNSLLSVAPEHTELILNPRFLPIP